MIGTVHIPRPNLMLGLLPSNHKHSDIITRTKTQHITYNIIGDSSDCQTIQQAAIYP